MDSKNYYKTLQVDPEAEPEVIESAYRCLAGKYHPDANRAPDATKRMQAINEAYQVLRDPARRREYDRLQPRPQVNRDAEAERQRPGCDEMVVTIAPGVTMSFVQVPAGEFLMGSDPRRDKGARNISEQPQHRVYVDEFYIGRYPVTNAQYTAYARARKLRFEAPRGKDDHPVVNVSWDVFLPPLSRHELRRNKVEVVNDCQ